MSIVAALVSVTWCLLAIAAFSMMPPRRAVIASITTAWLLLPNISIQLSGFPDLTKVSLTTLSILFGILVFDFGSLIKLRLRWYDAPIVIWCACPFFSSLLNGIGLYDGLSAVLLHFLTWGLPYFFGRIYFSDLTGFRELAWGIVIGGLFYLPFCLYEIRMSPSLHKLVYGFHPRDMLNTLLQKPSILASTWRPFVFFEHGLALCIFMATASILGVWLWKCGSVKRFHGLPIVYLLVILTVTALLCQGAGSIALMILALGVLFLTKGARMRLAVFMIWLIVPCYYALRIPNIVTADTAAAVVAWVLPSKADSLRLRMWQETVLMNRVFERPFFGWGRWGEGRRVSEDVASNDEMSQYYVGADGKIAGVDGLWLVALGNVGFVGLFSFTAVLLLPAGMAIRRIPGSYWGCEAVAPATGCTVVLIVHAIDYLFNGIYTPLPVVVAGGLTGLVAAIDVDSLHEYRSPFVKGTRVRVLEGSRRGAVTLRRSRP